MDKMKRMQERDAFREADEHVIRRSKRVGKVSVGSRRLCVLRLEEAALHREGDALFGRCCDGSEPLEQRIVRERLQEHGRQGRRAVIERDLQVGVVHAAPLLSRSVERHQFIDRHARIAHELHHIALGGAAPATRGPIIRCAHCLQRLELCAVEAEAPVPDRRYLYNHEL
eukprot:3790200-Prymnesium_polylepis.1